MLSSPLLAPLLLQAEQIDALRAQREQERQARLARLNGGPLAAGAAEQAAAAMAKQEQ